LITQLQFLEANSKSINMVDDLHHNHEKTFEPSGSSPRITATI